MEIHAGSAEIYAKLPKTQPRERESFRLPMELPGVFFPGIHIPNPAYSFHKMGGSQKTHKGPIRWGISAAAFFQNDSCGSDVQFLHGVFGSKVITDGEAA